MRGRGRLGKAKKDMAMLFTYACIDKYLKDGGKLGFLIPQTVFKSMAGEGFRRFIIPPGSSFRVSKVHDLVDLLPFEGAQNRTAAIFCIKGGKTSYPVPYILWKGSRIDPSLSLEEVQRDTSRIELEARPLMRETGPWSTLRPEAHKIIRKVVGTSAYTAYAGVYTGLNAAYWVRILQRLPDGNLLVENVTEGAKREVRRLQARIEASLVYPLLRGRDVGRWRALPNQYIILPTDDQGHTIQIPRIRVNYPAAYRWFETFFHELVGRSGEPYKTQLKPWRDKPRRIAETEAPPFYMLFNVSQSLACHKVVWKYIATDLTAAVVTPVRDNYLGEKTVIPNEKLMLVPCSSESEAHYICAVLNSSIAKLIARSYAVGTQISTHILEFVRLPRYDAGNQLHNRLADLSREAHRLTSQSRNGEVGKVEEEIDRAVAELFGLTDEELMAVKETLRLLEAEASEAEEEVREDLRQVAPAAQPRRVLEDLIEEFEKEG